MDRRPHGLSQAQKRMALGLLSRAQYFDQVFGLLATRKAWWKGGDGLFRMWLQDDPDRVARYEEARYNAARRALCWEIEAVCSNAAYEWRFAALRCRELRVMSGAPPGKLKLLPTVFTCGGGGCAVGYCDTDTDEVSNASD